LAGFDLTQRNRFGAIYAESIRYGAVQQKVRYSTDRIMKLRTDLALADFVIDRGQVKRAAHRRWLIIRVEETCGASH
jgi:hypothetical protein